MENIIIKNNKVSIRINFKGAELSSYYDKEKKIEHIWQADKNIWGRHAPILFPIVGQVKNAIYNIGNKEYSLSQHGFARDKVFELDEITDTRADFKLESDAESLKVYPYKFILRVIYSLVGKKLNIKYEVENIDAKAIFFSIGAHPGFTIPFNKDESFEDYYLEFSDNEKADRLLLSKSGLLSSERSEDYINNTNIIELKYSLFDQDALIFENLNSAYVDIKSRKHSNSLRVAIKSFPFLGIWTKPGAKAPFICIEPWYGITDYENSNGDFINKLGIESLKESEVFSSNYYIELN